MIIQEKAKRLIRLFLKGFLGSLMVLIIIPCSTKRNFKNLLNIPISQNQSEFQKKQNVCLGQSSELIIPSIQDIEFPIPIFPFQDATPVSLQPIRQVNIPHLKVTYNKPHISSVRLHQMFEQYII